MQVSAVHVNIVNLPFRFAFGHALASRSFSENVIVELHLRDQASGLTVVGLGESVPRQYVTGENVQEAAQYVREVLAPLVVGRSFPDAVSILDFLKGLFTEQGLDSKSLGASFCAFELAFLDALARLGKLGMTQFICRRLAASSLFSAEPKDAFFRYGGVVPFGKKQTLAALLSFYKLYGFKTVKLKVGKNDEDDLAKVKLAREVLGFQTTLRLDANCAWSLAQAERMMAVLRPYSPASLEQPLPADAVEDLAVLQSRIKETIIVDESLTTLESAHRLIETKACRGFNIRISKVGGLMAAVRLTELALSNKIEAHLGAQVGESGILASAQKHLALAACPGTFTNVEGAMNLFLLRRDLTRECQTVPFGAVVSFKPEQQDGLGVSLKGSRQLRTEL